MLEAKVVIVNKEPVALYQVLKFEGLVDSGGEAKLVIAAGDVKVNDIVETRKRRKIRAGDVIEFGHFQLTIDARKASS